MEDENSGEDGVEDEDFWGMDFDFSDDENALGGFLRYLLLF